MNSACRCFHKFADLVELAFTWFSMSCLVLLLGINVGCIIVDNFMNYSWPWLEELSTLLFGWVTFPAAAILCRRGGHIGVDLLFKYLPPAGCKILRMLNGLLMLLCAVVFTVFGWDSMVKTTQTSLYLDIPMEYYYASIAVSGLLFILFIIAFFVPGNTPDPDAPADFSSEGIQGGAA